MKRNFPFLGIFLFVFGILLGAMSFAQTTYYVDAGKSSGGNGTSWATAFNKFEDGVNAAQSGDVLFVAKGTYQPASGQSFTMKEGVKIYGGFAGTETTLAERNLNSGNTSILKGNGNSVIRNDNNGLTNEAVLDGFKITEGNAGNDRGGGVFNSHVTPVFNNLKITGNNGGIGGGMFVEYASALVLNNVAINNNTAGTGGGIDIEHTTATMNNITISGNTVNYAQGYAGGILNISSALTMTNATISNNTCTGPGGGMYNTNASSLIMTDVNIIGNSGSNGGGMYNYNISSKPLMTNVVISQNTANGQGGGIYNESTSAVFNRATINENTASGYGGGVYNQTSSSKYINATISGNSASMGGGIYAASDTLINVLVAGNKATNTGAGIYNLSVYLFLCNVTIAGNMSDLGGGGIFSSSPFFMKNSIILGNKAGQIGDGLYADISYVKGTNNLIQTGDETTGGQFWGTGELAVNSTPDAVFNSVIAPGLAPTTTGDYTLKPGSFPIDKGDSTLFIGLTTGTTDLAGNDRVIRDNIDLGAYEAFAVKGCYYVDSSNVSGTHNGISWATAFNKFEDGVNTAISGDTVFVAKGTYQPASGQSFYMKEGVKIYGGFAGTETKLAQRNLNSGNTSILKGSGTSVIMNNNNHLTTAALIDGFTITGGININSGGGMYNYKVSPSIANCIFDGNQATDGGGAMLNQLYAAPVITNCVFRNNTSSYFAGAIFNYQYANPVIEQCRFENNMASYYGGAIANYGLDDNSGSNADIRNCVFEANMAGQGGGAIYTAYPSSNILVSNSLFLKNKANDKGGAIIGYTSNINVINCDFIKDTANTATIYLAQGATLNLTNSIVWGNSSGITGGNVTYSLVQGMPADAVNFNIDGSASPEFIDSENDNYGLTPCSPLINKGTSDTVGLNLPVSDMAFMPRISGGRVDIGAYEFQSVVTANVGNVLFVDSASTCMNGSGNLWENAIPSFSRALFLADSINTNATSAADSIKEIWVAKGTYQPASGSYFAMVKDVKIYGGFAGTETTLAQRDLNAGHTSILKGNGSSVIRNIGNGLTSSAVLDGFTITGGNTGIYNSASSPTLSNLTISGNSAAPFGGGIYNKSVANPVITDVIISGNTASLYGGGIYNTGSSPTLNNVTIESNNASSGAGMYNTTASSPTLTTVTISENTATASGGGIFNTISSAPNLTDVTIKENTAPSGAGIYNANSSNPVITKVTISENQSTGPGGGMVNAGSSPILTNVIISGNIAASGGGVYNDGGANPTLTNVLVAGNVATNYGAGIYNGGSSPTLTNVTIAGNNSSLGGGVYNDGTSVPILYNSIVIGNHSGVQGTAIAGSSAHNLIQTGDETTGGKFNGGDDLVDHTTANDIFTSPLAPGQSTGGDYSLKPFSYPIDMGDMTLYIGLTPDTKDLGDSDRVIGNNIDLGAYEAPLPPAHYYVNVANTSGTYDGLSWATAFKKFEDGTNAAKSGDTVFVAKGTYQPANGKSFTMKEGMKIYGGFAGTESSLSQRNLNTGDTSYLKGNGNSVIRNDHNGLTADAILDGFKITGGNAATSGGGIYNVSSSPTLANLTISGNAAAYFGGGIYDSSSNATLVNVIISGNISPSIGGGIANYASSPTLTNVLISGNSAFSTSTNTIGGGIYNNETSSPTLINVTISGNMAGNGGGIFNTIASTNSVKLYNSIILGNSSGIQGTILNSSSAHNLIQSGDENSAADFDGTPVLSSQPENIFIRPLQPNTIPTSAGDYKLKQGSFAINNGDNTLYSNLTPDTKDLAGNNRVMGDVIDLGPYEVAPPVVTRYYVNASNVSGAHDGLSWATAFDKFEDGVNIAQTGDTVFVAKGIYQPANSGDYFFMKQGVKIYGSFAGTETALAQRDLSLGDTSVLLGNGNGVIRNVSNGLTSTSVLDGFKITGGNASSNPGGGLYNENASPTLANVWIFGNTGGLGGGMYNFYSSPLLTNIVINENQSSNGGGIYNVASSPLLTNVVIEKNNSGSGGGIFNTLTSSPILTNTIISGNSASFFGGGVYNGNNCFPILTNVALYGNMANSGGGMYNTLSSSPILTNVTISGNLGSVSGGGIYNNDNNSSPVLNNTIVLGNTTGIEGNPVSVSSTHNLIQTGDENSDGEFNGTGGAVANTAPGNIFVQPVAPIAPTVAGLYRLRPRAFAIDKGDGSLYPNLNAETKDIAGNDRVVGGSIDLGAYEAALITRYYVDSSNVSGVYDGAGWPTAFNKFEDALDVVQSGDTIFVAKGTYQPSAGSYFVMVKNVKIYGGFAGTETSLSQRDLNAGNISILEGNGNSVIQNDDNGLNSLALLDGFTVSDGSSSKGGGVYNNNSSPSFANCIFKNNQATVQGGGMHNEFSASPTITNCLFQNNSAGTGGGGVFNYYNASPKISQSKFISNTSTNGGGLATNTNANPVITNCEFKWNVATGTGGAINNNSSDGVKIINCLIIRNRANDNGGGINNITSSPLIVNCTFSQDTSAASGGAINNTNSSPIIENCIISGNTSGIANTGASSPVITYSLVQEMAADATTHNLDGSLLPYFFSISNDSYGLSSCSPAINAGNPDTTGLGLLTVDMSGQPRIFSDVIDMGAFEAQTPSNAINILSVDEVQPTCSQTDGSIVFNGNFINNQSYHIQYTLNNVAQAADQIAGEGSVTLPALGLGSYDHFVVTNTAGCFKEMPATPIALGNQDETSYSELAEDGTTVSQLQGNASANIYVSPDCKLVAKIETDASNDSLGLVAANVNIAPELLNSETPFVARYYDIQTGQDAGANVTLYFTDAEVQAYNVAALGAGRAVVAEPENGVSNILIMAYHGAGSNGPTGNYDLSTSEVMIPAEVEHRNGIWSVRFSTNSFSGFFAYTDENESPLPIILQDIHVQNIGTKNQVSWQTASENQGDYFEIERSRNAVDFEVIGRVEANGSNQGGNYIFVDEYPYSGINYYRLQMDNGAGSKRISKVVSATVKTDNFSMTVYPNPVKDLLKVKVSGMTAEKARITLMDVSGRIFSSKDILNDNELSLPMAKLPGGLYLIHYTDGLRSETIKVIKK